MTRRARRRATAARAARVPQGAWRAAAYIEWRQLCDELRRVVTGGEATRDREIAQERLDEARTTLSTSYRGQRLALFYSGAQIQRACSCLAEARRALLMLLDDHALRARIPLVRRTVLDNLASHDPERAAALADLKRIEQGAEAITTADRERLRAISAMADEQADRKQREVRAFRNLLLIFSALLGALLAGAALVHAIDSSLISMCTNADPALNGDLCPNGTRQPGSLDVAQVQLVGALGGLLAAIMPLAKARRLRGPYGLAVMQSALKVVGGATVAFVGVLLLQGGALAGLSPQPGSRVLAYAAFFGVGQQALTTFVDRRVGDLAPARAAQGDAGRQAH